MSEDIRAGDVVVCVEHKFNRCPDVSRHWIGMENVPSALVEGRTYTVAALRRDEATGEIGLVLAEVAPRGRKRQFCAGRFRKPDAPKSELSERIRACRPITHREKVS